MAALKRNRATWVLILLLATGFFLLREFRGNAATSASQTISVPRTFASLDGSAGEDDDGVVNGVFTKNGDLTIADGGSITCDNVGTPASACPTTLQWPHRCVGWPALAVAEPSSRARASSD